VESFCCGFLWVIFEELWVSLWVTSVHTVGQWVNGGFLGGFLQRLDSKSGKTYRNYQWISESEFYYSANFVTFKVWKTLKIAKKATIPPKIVGNFLSFVGNWQTMVGFFIRWGILWEWCGKTVGFLVGFSKIDPKQGDYILNIE